MIDVPSLRHLGDDFDLRAVRHPDAHRNLVQLSVRQLPEAPVSPVTCAEGSRGSASGEVEGNSFSNASDGVKRSAAAGMRSALSARAVSIETVDVMPGLAAHRHSGRR